MAKHDRILELSRRYADDTTKILSTLVQTRSFGGGRGRGVGKNRVDVPRIRL